MMIGKNIKGEEHNSFMHLFMLKILKKNNEEDDEIVTQSH